MIEIDGRTGEGGGQILRSALTLSMVTHRPFRITHIRANRRNPGLSPQHLAGVKAATQLTNADVAGDVLRSQSLTFIPQTMPQAGSYIFDISKLSGQGSAGAVSLLLQVSLLPLALVNQPSTMVLRGGTHVAWSPPLHYVQDVLLPMLARMGLNASVDLVACGWYPRGGGEVLVQIPGSAKLQGTRIRERGPLRQVGGEALASNLPSHIPQRIANRVMNRLHDAGMPGNVKAVRRKSASTGAGVFLWAEHENAFAGFDQIGAKGISSEQVADRAVEQLLSYCSQPAPLDRYLPDQLLIACALAAGDSTLTTQELTSHTLTNAQIVPSFVDVDIQVVGDVGKPGYVKIKPGREAASTAG